MPATITAVAAADAPDYPLHCAADGVTWSRSAGAACWVCGHDGVPDLVVGLDCDSKLVMQSSACVNGRFDDVDMFVAEIRHTYSPKSAATRAGDHTR